MKFTLKGKTRYNEIFKWTGIVVILFIIMIFINDGIFWISNDDVYSDDPYYSEEIFEDCNIAKIELKGFIDIESYEQGSVGSSDIMKEIKNAENSGNIKAIILDIDSSGGVAVAGEEISDAFNRAEKPTVAVIRAMGTSAAYQSAIGADTIFASADSVVGSIGTTMSYVDNVRKNQIEGLTYNQISSGKYKDMFDPDKSLTYEEKQLIQRDVDITANNFIKAVAEKRNLDISKVKALADGSSVAGQMALDNGLIDYIGSLYDAEQFLSEMLGEEAVVCE